MRSRFAVAVLLAAALHAFPAAAQPVIDGTRDAAFYGAPRSVQDTPTAFGNAVLGHRRISTSGSELDGAWARATGGRLYLFVAGNLETGTQGLDWSGGIPNRLELFLDVRPGGQNVLRADNADVDGDGLNRMGPSPPDAGLRFDAGFAPDVYFTFFNYTEVVPTPDPQRPHGEAWRGAMWYATLPTAGGGAGEFLGVGADPLPNSHPNEHTLAHDVRVGFDNRNVAGVTGTGDPSPSAAGAELVTTGIELSIPLALLEASGPLDDTIRVALLVNSRTHDFLSNQTLGPLTQPSGGYGNLGEPRVADFTAIPGAQWFPVPLEAPVGVTPRPGGARLSLGPAAPHPARGAVAFDVVAPAGARLEILDLQGRRVAVLFDGVADATRVAWDGRDGAGGRVAPGLYLARLTGDGATRSRRVVLLAP